MARARMYGIWVDGIGPRLAVLEVGAVVNTLEAMEQGQEEVQTYAKYNAPWADRSGAARNGLTASVYEDGGEIVLELAHTVDYGVWLETIQDGHFAIILPTLEALGPKIIRDAGGAVMGFGGGGF